MQYIPTKLPSGLRDSLRILWRSCWLHHHHLWWLRPSEQSLGQMLRPDWEPPAVGSVSTTENVISLSSCTALCSATIRPNEDYLPLTCQECSFCQRILGNERQPAGGGGGTYRQAGSGTPDHRTVQRFYKITIDTIMILDFHQFILR